MIISENDGNKILRAFCTLSTLNFTQHFFKMKMGKDFIVNTHHQQICNALDQVIDGKIKRLIINIAPRYSKTELAVKNFIAYGLMLNPASKFIHLSYSDDLANDNSEEIRDLVKSSEYQAIAPYVQIKKTTDSKKKWYTTAGGGVYAVSAAGQVTGFGAGSVDEEAELSKQIDEINSTNVFSGAIVIDDPIKPDDALSDTIRERVNNRFESTIRNRVNSRNTPIIIVMQRLHEHDLCGYLQELEPDDWTVLSLPCIYNDENGNEKALWEHKHTLDELRKIEKNNSFVFQTQYMQNPKPLEGLMYREFRTYETIPFSNYAIKKNYTDTADTGSNYLCSICYDELPNGNYITDILYSKKPMEYTEPKTIEMLSKNETKIANIESNNGGRGFARNVEKGIREIGNSFTQIEWFHQSENKNVRIFTKANEVNNLTFFPVGWEHRWPEFAAHIKSYRKEGKNAFDDAPDALTGTVEKRGTSLFNDIQTLDSMPDNITNKFVLIMPSINEYFVSVSAGLLSDKIVIIDVIFNKDGASNKDKAVNLFTDKSDSIFDSPKEWFSLGTDIRSKNKFTENLRINLSKGDQEEIVNIYSNDIKDKIIFIDHSIDSDYSRFKQMVKTYIAGMDITPIYALSKIMSYYSKSK